MTSNESGTKGNKKNKKQQQQLGDEQEVPELTKEETSIARHLRLNCPTKQATLAGMKVDYFVGNKLVDSLMESKWGPGTLNPQTSKKTDAFLPSRQACINFMQRLMNKQLFYRAYKVYKETSDANKSKDTNTETTPNLRKRKEKKENQSSSATPSADTVTPSPDSPDSKQQQQQQKRKFKLEMHDEQKFIDNNEPFVWVYDPTSTKTYIIGSLLILGAIGICLFPLWPSQVREGVYYLSLAGASFLGAILGLAAFKYVLFAFIWILTTGKVSFWLFPNLTEDVGFFESFVPVYKCNLKSNDAKEKKEAAATGEEEEKKELLQEPQPSQAETTSENLNAENTTEPATSRADAYPTLKDISKSTIEICKSDTPKGSPALTKSKLKKKDSLVNDEDGFELVDDNDLIKEDKD